MPGWPCARRGLPFRWIGAGVASPAPRSGRLLQAGRRAFRALGRVGMPRAISWAARRTLWSGLAHLHHQGAQGLPAWCSGTAATGLPHPGCAFDVLAQVQAGHALGRGVGRADGARNAAHQPPGQHAAQQRAVAQNRVSATWARWLLCAIWAPAASIASRCDCASCCNDPRPGRRHWAQSAQRTPCGCARSAKVPGATSSLTAA